MKVGILGYGVYVPVYRLRIEEICSAWMLPQPISTIKRSRGVNEVAVCSWHEDAVVMAVEASKAALEMSGVSADKIDGIYLGTCTNPYVTKPSVTMVAECLKLKSELLCADCQFASKSGTSALQMCFGLVGASVINYGIAVGSDSVLNHVAPNDPLELTASAGAASLIVGKDDFLAEIESTYSYVTQSADFFRLDGDRYIKRGVGPDEEKIGYVDHLVHAVEGFMEKFGEKPSDFDYVALGQPDGNCPLSVAKRHGFTRDQLQPGLIVDKIGDSGCASVLMSLAAILDRAEPEERILLASYGYGAGCDVFSLTTTALLAKKRRNRRVYPALDECFRSKVYVSYSDYLRMQRKIIQEFV